MEKGDHIAVWTTNVPEWVQLQFGTGKMGAPIVTVNTNYRASELEYLLKQSDSKTIILIENFRDHSFINTLQELCPELAHCEPGNLQSKRLPLLKNVVLIGENKYPGVLNWSDVLAAAEQVTEDQLDIRQGTLSHDDVINIQYTSGTTGFPKGVMLTHYNLVNNAINIAECMKLTHEDRLCIPVPFFHCFGCVIGTLAITTSGGTMVPIQEFSAGRSIANGRKRKVYSFTWCADNVY